MDSAALLLVLAITGVNFGWQPAENSSDGYEYIVQVEPELLDVLQRGDAMPIESNIPADVTPIRKIRIVVGREELPRSHVRHTAHFADPPAWPPQYPAAPAGNTNDNRYAAPAAPAATGVGPPPNVLDRAATAVDETTRALSEGVQAAAESAGNQFSRAGNQLMNGAANTTQGMGQQLQQWTTDATRQLQETGNNLRTATSETIGAANDQLRQAETPFSPTGASSSATSGSGVSEPPWPYATSNTSTPSWSAGAAAAQNSPASNAATPATSTPRPAIGWTGIAPNVAAPPLLNQSPPAVTTPNAGPNPRIAGNNARGPTFPAGATTAQEPLHSRLIDPASQSTAAGATATSPPQGWDGYSTTTQPTISRNGNGAATGNAQNALGTISGRPLAAPTAQDTRQAADRWGDPWLPEPQGGLPSTPPMQNSGSFANSGQPTNGSTTPSATTSSATTGNTTGFPPSHISHAGTAAGFQQSPNNQATQVPTAEQPPWLPLLIVSLSLVGSLSANLFLGWSYMDARQKYRALVRKTADTFRRVAGAAAA